MRSLAFGLGVLLCAAAAGRAQLFTPEAEGTPEGAQLDLALTDLKAGRSGDALARVSAALSREAARVGKGEGSLSPGLALAGWAEDFRRELERADGEGSRAALDALRADPEAGPTEFVRLSHAVINRAVAAEAVANAAERSAALGDLRAARTLYKRAVAQGWRGVEAAGVRGVATDAVSTPTVPVLAESWWWTKSPDRLGGTRSFVLAATDMAFVASATHVLAIREGRVVWGYPSVPAPGPTLRPSKSNPARLDFPAYGSALSFGVLVTRTAPGARIGELSAFRARDGKPLWSTRGSRLHIASLPAISGRFVYALAADTNAPAALSLIALDLMTGQELFRSRLGSLSEPVPPDKRLGAPELWDEATAPAVSEDAVYVAIGGAVWKLDRFDGGFLLAATYRLQASVAREGNLPSEQPMSRWTATPILTDKLVLVATRDAEPIRALDREALEPVWQAHNLGNYTLFAANARYAFLQGPELIALDLSTGQRGYTIAPRAGAPFTGPAHLWAELLVAPTPKGTMAFQTKSGELLQNPPLKLPLLRPWVSGETAGILRAADALRAFFKANEIENLANPR